MKETPQVLTELLRNWDIPPIEAVRPTPEGGGKTWFVETVSGESFVLKASELVHAEREYTFRAGLSLTRLPVAPPVCAIDGHWHVPVGSNKVYCLYPKLPGATFTDHYTGDYAKRASDLGQAIGLLHTCLSELGAVRCNRELRLVQHIQEWALPAIGKARTNAGVDSRSVEEIWIDAEQNLISLEKAAPVQLIHRDPHPSNVLFDRGRLTGFIDFELVTHGLRLFDVCYCGSAILVTGFRDVEKARKWFGLFHALLCGYQEHQALTVWERACIYEMLVAIQVIFLAYWLTQDNVAEAVHIGELLAWLKEHKGILESLELG